MMDFAPIIVSVVIPMVVTIGICLCCRLFSDHVETFLISMPESLSENIKKLRETEDKIVKMNHSERDMWLSKVKETLWKARQLILHECRSSARNNNGRRSYFCFGFYDSSAIKLQRKVKRLIVEGRGIIAACAMADENTPFVATVLDQAVAEDACNISYIERGSTVEESLELTGEQIGPHIEEGSIMYESLEQAIVNISAVPDSGEGTSKRELEHTGGDPNIDEAQPKHGIEEAIEHISAALNSGDRSSKREPLELEHPGGVPDIDEESPDIEMGSTTEESLALTGEQIRLHIEEGSTVDEALEQPIVHISAAPDSGEGTSKKKPELAGAVPDIDEVVRSLKMTVKPKISINDGNMVVYGKTILKGVLNNIILTPGPGVGLVDGAFIGATASYSESLHVFPIGVLEDLRFMCLFQFKLWQMTQRMGHYGRDVPFETQFMLIESKDETDEHEDSPTIYTLFLPLLEGPFRAVLQGNENNELEICLESGDNAVETNQGLYLVYMHAGTNPFEVINQAIKAVEKHMQTFVHREKKKLPSFLDWFGWCTWDAFYTDVTAEGVDGGLKSLSEGGTPPRFLIIDDGWQQIEGKPKDDNIVVQEEAQFARRLTEITKSSKFKKNEQNNEEVSGLAYVVSEAKKKHNVKYAYAWHATIGYWGGEKPATSGMEHYETALAYPISSPGVKGNQPNIVFDNLSVHGLGLVHPKKVFNFYNELHAYLASCGIDGVKVDVQYIIETLGAGHGGRVSLTRNYIQALEASVARNFPDNGCITCTCHKTDVIYSAKQIAVVRASDDFYPRDPVSHTIHISSVAYNSLFLGEIMQPDWDTFHSLHPAAEYHAAARAIGGCAIYVSDKPGCHNFHLLKQLVLPDGSVLRAQLPGRPTRDCLFADPTRDGITLLKIWNLNKCSGVVGVFNCQGAGWCKIAKTTLFHDASPCALTGSVRATDVDLISQVAGADWSGETIVYAYRSGEVVRLRSGAAAPVTLKVLEYELFHICPLKEITPGISFAPIGLLNMLNSGGAVEQSEINRTPDKKEDVSPSAIISLKVYGCGKFGAYCSQRPLKCIMGENETDFNYDSATGLMTLNIPVPEEEAYRWPVEIQV